MSLNYVISFRKNKILWIFLLAFLLFYTPLLFSNPYLEQEPEPIVKPSWTCKRDSECIRYLNSDLDTQNDYSLYKICHNEYKHVKTCCESLNNCSSNYGVSRELNNLKINLLNSADNQAVCSANNMPSLIASIEGMQKEVCQLGAKNCKTTCENKLNEFKQRVKNCFSINSSLDEALKQAKSSQNDSVCYSDLKLVAERYKRQSLKGKSELRENLSVQDIVDCEGVRNKGKGAVGAKKAMELCSEVNQELLVRQQQEQAEKEELERQEREKERLEELERQKEEEHRRKQEEFEDRARMIQADMGYITNENKGALDSQAQGFGIKGQSPEDQKSQVYGSGAIKTSEIKEPKEPVKKETTEKEKKEDKKPDSEAEDKSEKDKKEDEKPEEKDKKTEKQTADSSKSDKASKDKNSNKLKSSKQNRADKDKPATSSSSQKSSLQTPTKPLKSQKAQSKKTTAKKKPSNNPNDLKAVSQKTKTSDTKTSQTISSSPAQSAEKAPISSFTGNIINACPISMPQIKSAVVYQSVEAPQIEDMEKQESQPYPNIPRFKSYDLVMGKPAGILVELNTFRMDKNKEFALDLYLGGKNDFDCFHFPLKGEIMQQRREKACFFKEADLKISEYKFFLLPMAGFLKKDRTTHKVQVSLYPRGYKKHKSCRETVDFNIKIIKTHDLKLGFTRIASWRTTCFASRDINTGYDPTPIKTVEAFVRSDEVQFYIPSMFPIKNVLSKVLRYSLYGKDFDFVRGLCNNKTGKKRPTQTFGLLEDIRNLEYLRASLKYDKLVAIVPENYFVFHRGIDHDSVGFIISPKWDWRWFAFWRWRTDFLGGSWNIAFVHEEELNSGTVAHELAHTLGEEKEHYDSAGEFCRRFKGSPYKPCHTYTVEKALNTWTVNRDLFFQFVEKKFSIMNNESGIENQWILRDTFQKVFAVLSKKAVIPHDEKLHADKSLYYRKERRSSLKAVVSGFYDKKEQAFVLPQIKLRSTKLLTPSLYPQTENTKLPVITFQLKEGKKILQTIKRPILKMQIKTLYKKKSPKTEDFDFSPTIAVFKLPAGFRGRKLRIDVLGPDKTIMFKRLIPIKVKKKKKDLISLNNKIK